MATTATRIPVDLVTGFLGSGKTTLVNAVLRDPAFAGAMVIVNEFGEVGLDHALMAAADDQVVLLDSGCLCCAASGTLRDTLIDLFARRASGSVPPFDRIVVETSGLAHPGPLVASLLGDSALTPRCTLSQVLVLVDGVNGAHTLARYAEAQRQIAFADRVLIGKSDIASADAQQALAAQVRTFNASASIEAWQRGDSAVRHFSAPAHAAAPQRPATGWLGGGPLRPQYAAHDGDNASNSNSNDDGDHESHSAAFHRIGTHVLRIEGPVDWATYAAWTQALSARLGKRLLRCKGLLALGDDGAPWVVQGVQGYFASPERLDAWPADVPRGFLVCIGESITRAELDAIVAPAPSTLTTHEQP